MDYKYFYKNQQRLILNKCNFSKNNKFFIIDEYSKNSQQIWIYIVNNIELCFLDFMVFI